MKILPEIINKIKKKFNSPILNLHEPSIKDLDFKMVKKSMRENEISSYGKYNKIFEYKLSNYLGCRDILSTINGTSALHLLMKTLNVDNNEEVLVQSLTYVSTINSILYCNSIPHFIDVDNNLNVNIDKLENYLIKNTFQKKNICYNKITKKKIRFLIVVHINGLCSDIIKLKKILKKFKINLIEDAAEALGCFFNGKHLGLFGDGGILSFNGNKIITTGGGGALYFRSKKLYLKSFKLATNCKFHKNNEIEYFDIGYNYRLPSINAALGISQLKRIEKTIKKKKAIFDTYNEILKKYNDIEVLKPIEHLRSNYWLTNVRIKNLSKTNKKKFLKIFWENKIFLRPVWKPIHLMKKFNEFPKMNLDGSEIAYQETFSLPSSEFLLDKKR